MSRVQLQTAYRVDIIESERGYGQKLEDTLYFDNDLEAKAYCKTFNASNTDAFIPDWYMVAEYRGRVG
jgi:hypothetical protein